MSMTLVLYNFTGDDTKVDKTSQLSTILTLTGELRSETDISHPSMIIETTPAYMNTCNYAYISDFGRYYFIRKRTIINPGVGATNTGTYRIDMDVDPLMSWKTPIGNTYALVSRCDYTSYRDEFIYDSEVPVSSFKGHSKFAFPNNPFATHVSSGTEPTYHYNICVTTVSDKYNTLTGSSNVSNLPIIFEKNYEWISSNQGNLTSYAMDVYHLYQMMKYLTSDNFFTEFREYIFQQNAEGVVGVVGYPFDLTALDPLGVSTNRETVRLGHADMSYYDGTTLIQPEGYRLSRNYLAILDFGTLDLTSYKRDFRDLEPISEYYAILPYVGVVRLNASDVLGSEIALSYIIDVTTGDGTAYIYNPNVAGVIYGTYQCRLGWKIVLTGSNALKLIDQKISGGTQLALGTVLAGLNVASGNALGIASGTKTIVSGLQSGMFEKTQYSGAMGEGRANANVDPHAYIFVTRAETADPNNDIAPVIGFPCNQYLQLSTFTGHGYVRVGEIHPPHYSGATNEEMDQIISLLKTGVHF